MTRFVSVAFAGLLAAANATNALGEIEPCAAVSKSEAAAVFGEIKTTSALSPVLTGARSKVSDFLHQRRG